MRDLVLASTSRYRRALLDRLGVPYRAVAPRCDEEGLDVLRAEERSLALAERKARSVAADFPGALLLGSDQIAEIEGRALRKPGTIEAARATLRLLSGREHRLVTAVALLDSVDGRVENAIDIARLRMRKLSHEEIENYLGREEVLDCVGAYRSEGLGAALFEWMRADDPTGIVGLPLTRVVDLLARFGVSVLR
ncbi:MAG: Maf family protein [Candidatus Eisenbacteria bacterium]